MQQTAQEKLRARLKLKQLEAKKSLGLKQPEVVKRLAEARFDLVKLPRKSVNLLAGATLTTGLLLTPHSPPDTIQENQSQQVLNLARGDLIVELRSMVPEKAGHLDADAEGQISDAIRKNFGIEAKAELSGNRLNHSFGWVGYEQHLKRYPGDSLRDHGEEFQAGIAPGRGAWGYFADSKTALTSEDITREKYYFAVQTLYLPNWEGDLKNLREWYKYRKMIMVNPENGKAVVGVIADSGPARFTGKQFGASPEAMKHLGLSEGPRKGRVLLYFVDESGGNVPLGPAQYRFNVNLASL